MKNENPTSENPVDEIIARAGVEIEIDDQKTANEIKLLQLQRLQAPLALAHEIYLSVLIHNPGSYLQTMYFLYMAQIES